MSLIFILGGALLSGTTVHCVFRFASQLHVVKNAGGAPITGATFGIFKTQLSFAPQPAPNDADATADHLSNAQDDAADAGWQPVLIDNTVAKPPASRWSDSRKSFSAQDHMNTQPLRPVAIGHEAPPRGYRPYARPADNASRRPHPTAPTAPTIEAGAPSVDWWAS